MAPHFGRTIALTFLIFYEQLSFAFNSTAAVVPGFADLCSPSALKADQVGNSFCTHMSPRNGHFTPKPAATSPWKIYTWKPEIRQQFSHPVVLGSDEGKEIFLNYMVTARRVEDGQIVGHFEYQWDATAHCCYIDGRNYSYEGRQLHPNFLVGTSSQRVQTPNQTVLWTAPKHFEGPIVFVATFWTANHHYWANVTSEEVQVVNRNTTQTSSTPVPKLDQSTES